MRQLGYTLGGVSPGGKPPRNPPVLARGATPLEPPVAAPFLRHGALAGKGPHGAGPGRGMRLAPTYRYAKSPHVCAAASARGGEKEL